MGSSCQTRAYEIEVICQQWAYEIGLICQTRAYERQLFVKNEPTTFYYVFITQCSACKKHIPYLHAHRQIHKQQAHHRLSTYETHASVFFLLAWTTHTTITPQNTPRNHPPENHTHAYLQMLDGICEHRKPADPCQEDEVEWGEGGGGDVAVRTLFTNGTIIGHA